MIFFVRAVCVYVLAVSSVACSSLSATGRCEAAVATRLQEDVRRVVDGFYAADTELLLEFTHPSFAERFGEPMLRQLLEKSLIATQEAGLSLESLSFPEKPTCLAAGTRQFAIVPTLTTAGLRGGVRVQSLHFQIGIRDSGASSWSYADGTLAPRLRELFPEFPQHFEFPPTHRARLQ